ncbi:MAG: nucleotidyltransferase domain-containing protein [Candidatus Thiodiazotropha taylori]|nr:nucleotidyltransferase domain-containing protein [Candidatus Thiodiazotropha endolucinida]MCW4227701.1 nucleotidyltransferase domain-containing protein [Candidatus Thiodiazotropha taylori]
MSMHVYAFGSLCRGEIDIGSDIDLLACLSEPNPSIDPNKFSIYSYDRIKKMWKEGNPFSWHLHLESKLIYSSDNSNFLENLEKPEKYVNAPKDCNKFRLLFSESYNSLLESSNSMVFNLSCMFLATRNFATCFSLGVGNPIFSRQSPLLIDNPLPVKREQFDIFVRARILSTRGYGIPISEQEAEVAKSTAPVITEWMDDCLSTEGAL